MTLSSASLAAPMIRVVTAVVVLIVVGTGCGGRSEGQAFRDDHLRPLEQRMELRRARVAATLRVVRSGNKRDAAALREDIDGLARSVAGIAALAPPASAREPFARYVLALRGLVTELRRFTTALRADDGAKVRDLAARVQTDAGAVQTGHDDLERALVGGS